MHYLPNDPVAEEMLGKMGLSSMEDLFADIPEDMRVKRLDLPPGISEVELVRTVDKMMKESRGAGDMPMFLGCGFYDHFIPSAVEYVMSRSELYTSYTPYQPEMSQGILQALFEYQSMMSDILKMDVVNTSMYDYHTAIGEAILMAKRMNHRNVFLLPEIMAREKFQVVENYIRGAGIETRTVPFKDGTMDLDALKGMLTGEVSGVYIENPNILGLFDKGAMEIRSIMESRQVLVVGVNPMTLSIAKPPGDYGADIVVGDVQPLGVPISYGGPTAGIFAVSMKNVRKMPGRIIGATKDAEGRRAFAMTLSTREQHIRRERATSNICTNEALTSIMASAYLASLGKGGFRELGLQLASRGRYLAGRIDELEGFRAPAFAGHFFNEFPVSVDVSVSGLLKECRNRGVLAGYDLSRETDLLEGTFTVATTEMHTNADYEKLLEVLVKSREVLL
ncbi:MAG: aminomethyl-transferring glycine dehydrogenase subunit GcvPA [Thermoplasmata archaeon]|nr:MAG: aminomethyl-transferring glycine dehydrogenase subunit GcvPA [Thermoplasmata archaeon]